MSQYVSYSGGPGSIGALKPLAALSHAPTIGSNAPRRVIGNVTHAARSIPSMGMGAYSGGVFANGDGVFNSCGCSMGTDPVAASEDTEQPSEGGLASSIMIIVFFGTIGWIAWGLVKESREKKELEEEIARERDERRRVATQSPALGMRGLYR